MKFINKIKELVIGKPLNALNPKIKEHIALIAIIAWIGLGADGLSSSAYGPEQAFLALGPHKHIAIYLSIATAITVFLISFAYNQVIELFPNGGGGYKVATHLLGPNYGVISGCALIIDYMLTIATSIVSGVETIFSMMPPQVLAYKVEVEIAIVIFLMVLNLRGMKESIKVLLPIFVGFLITHLVVILVGIFYHSSMLNLVIPDAINDTRELSSTVGITAMLAILLRAYSLGGSTYTGLEAVSNNVSTLAEPRVRTGKITMLYMAVSLSFTAGGIILLYLLWDANPIFGQTLNAVVYSKIVNDTGLHQYWLPSILFFEAALLFVGANTGFLGCPAVMANMAVDKWLPRQFRELSDRLVTQNGVLVSGIASILLILWAHGDISTLVVLYSINVFLTFTLSLLGLCRYWIKSRRIKPQWWRKLILSGLGFILCLSILIITTFEKFAAGGWLTILITWCTIAFCFAVKRHYKQVGLKLREADGIFANQLKNNIQDTDLLSIDNKNEKTAVLFVTKHIGSGLHALLWIQRLFPDTFKNYVFLTAGEIDSEVLAGEEIFTTHYRKDLHGIVTKYRNFCTQHNIPSEGLFSYGINEIEELLKLAFEVKKDYPDCVFFASELVYINENWWTRKLHTNTTTILQRRLHLEGAQMIIIPMKI